MILYLGNKLSSHGFTPTSVETLGNKLSGLDLKVITKSTYKNKFFRFADMLFAIFKYRKKHLVVLIDTYSTTAFWFAYASGKLCSLLKIPYIPILRGGDLPERIDHSFKSSRSYFTTSFSNIAVSNYLFEEFRKRNLPVQLIHNYLEINKYPFKLRQYIHTKLLWVRSFHEIYNPQLALLVLQKVSNDFPGTSLCMVGPDKDGTLRKCQKMAMDLKLDVTFPGRLSKEDWISLSTNYDIFINTTNIDNTPISVMEAMALGMPVVTTNAGGIPYLFENGSEGIMVNKNNPEEMAQAVISLIKDPVKAEIISGSARKKAEQWDWTLIGPEWKKLLDDASSTIPLN